MASKTVLAPVTIDQHEVDLLVIGSGTGLATALAAKELGIEGLDSYLKGPTAVAFGHKDPASPAKILSDFIKKTKKMELKCAVIDKQTLDAAGAQALADLPPKEVLIAKMMGSLNAPITNFVGVLSATLRSLVYAIEAVRKQKGGEE